MISIEQLKCRQSMLSERMLSPSAPRNSADLIKIMNNEFKITIHDASDFVLNLQRAIVEADEDGYPIETVPIVSSVEKIKLLVSKKNEPIEIFKKRKEFFTSLTFFFGTSFNPKAIVFIAKDLGRMESSMVRQDVRMDISFLHYLFNYNPRRTADVSRERILSIGDKIDIMERFKYSDPKEISRLKELLKL